MDDKESSKDFDIDFDYDLYATKYGIDLRAELSDEELAALIESENTEGSENLEKSLMPSNTVKPTNPVSSGRPSRSVGPAKPAGPVKSDEEAEEAEKQKDDSHVRMELYDWLQCIVSAILCGILIFVFVGRVIGVDGYSMLQTLHNQDKVVMTDLFYTPRYGDIVVIDTDAFNEPIVKRVIATAGQTIDIDFETGDVMIDEKIIREDYINELTHDQEQFEGPLTIPDGFVFVMGDNRNASTDSRSSFVDLVDTRQILGKVLFILIPGKDDSSDRNWSRIGSVYRAQA